MTIQVGHPHECPTFFCPPPMRKSTSQQVNESTSRCPISRISPPPKKSPFFILRQKYSLFAVSIPHIIKWIYSNRPKEPSLWFALVCFFCLVWVIIKSGAGVAYF